MHSLRKHLSYANVAATLALVFAMSGGALAAKHYLINSTSQINPKVLKKLRGAIGKPGATGASGASGVDGAPGKEGLQGQEGKRGPSDVYEAEIGKVVIAKAEESKSLTLSNLPAGTYAVFGKASVTSEEQVKNSSGRCELRAEGEKEDDDLSIEPIVPLGKGEEWSAIPTELTHTFAATGQVTMTCRATVNWYFGKNPVSRIVAIRVDSQHKTTPEAG